jgi:hypothetical protein
MAQLCASQANAQTWVSGRTTPALGDIVAIDATGEQGWLYGFEDLAGDGQDFKQPEQSVDIRTAYASTDAQRFWSRVYVSDPNAAGGNVVVFVFIDNDQDPNTGGSAAATDIHAKLVGDPSNGGYEYVIEIAGNGSINEIWEWRAMQSLWQGTMPQAAQAEAESGTDVDPVEINGSDHGYLQGMVDMSLVGLTQACEADLFVRSIISSGNGDGDLEVGTIAPCIPADDDGDGVPDLLIPPNGCTNDAECPGSGLCIEGRCIVPQPCIADADCDADERCVDDICMPVPGGACSDSAECGDLVCRDGQCQGCTFGGNECSGLRRCAADGRCVDDPNAPPDNGLDPGDEAQGGALTCSYAAAPRGAWALIVALFGLLAMVCRRWSRVS